MQNVSIRTHLCAIRRPSSLAEQLRGSVSTNVQDCWDSHDYQNNSFKLHKVQNAGAPNAPPSAGVAGDHDSQHQQSMQNIACSFEHVSHDKLDSESVIQSLCHQGQLAYAVDVLSDIDRALSADTYMCLLRACNRSKLVNAAREVCEHLTFHIPQFPGFLGNYLVVTLAKCNAIEEARSVLRALPYRTVYSWTAMISAYAFSGHPADAIEMHTSMLYDGVEPSSYTYVSLLKACGISQNLWKGRSLHAEVLSKGFTSDVFVGSTLISMYGKCGEIKEAEIVFNELAQRNIVTWNAMLSAYVEQDQGRKCLQCYRQMQEEGTGSDQHTFLFALQACAFLVEQEKCLFLERCQTNLISVEIVQSLYADAQRYGFASDVFVGSTFVRMFGKCGAIAEAEHAFSSLAHRNVVSWTAMLAAYVEHEVGKKALQLYRQMHAEGLNPDRLAAVGALQACCSLAEDKKLIGKGRLNKVIALEIGQAVGADFHTKGASTDVVLGTALLTMYGKCGAIMEAEHTFGSMSERTIVSWSALISVFIGQGHFEKALQLYRQMQMEGVSPDRQATVSALQAVCFLADYEVVNDAEGQSKKVMLLGIGFGLHSDTRRKGGLSDVFVSNTLLSMYGKCGAIAEAEQVFLTMPRHNVVSWTAMLSAHLEQGQGERVLQLYVQMLKKSIVPDYLALVITLQACCILAEKEEVAVKGRGNKALAMEVGQALHDDLQTLKLESNSFVCTALLNLYGKCGAIEEAENIFMALVEPDMVSWSAMLSVYVDQNHSEKALLLYRQMYEEGLRSDPVTSVVVLRACSILAETEKTFSVARNSTKAAALEIGRAVHADAYQKSFAHNLAVGNTIISMYGKCGALLDAEHVFGAIYPRNIVTWNAMISAYAEQGEDNKALTLYDEMQRHSVTTDDVTLILTLKACCTFACLDLCNCLHFDIVCAGYEAMPSLAHAYGGCASFRDSNGLLNQLSESHLGSWNASITCHAGEGNSVASLHLFEESKLMGIVPDGITFTSVISACSRTGLVMEGSTYFLSMKEHDLIPEGKHYGSMLDLLARVGDFTRVEAMLEMMPMQADETVWLCLLGACQTHCNVDLAKHAFDCALKIRPKHGAAYVALSNVYAYAGF